MTPGRENPSRGARFTEEQIIAMLKQLEVGRAVAELSHEYAISEAMVYAWQPKYGMTVTQACRLR